MLLSTAKFIESKIDESISTVYWWNDIDRGRQKCHFVPYKPHMDWFGIEKGPSK
jgi:hypothetical protein